MRASMKSPFPVVYVCAVVSVTTLACFKRESGPAHADLPEFQEGGTITLDMQGQQYTVKLTEAYFANTDRGDSDYVEMYGPETVLCAPGIPRDLDFDSNTPTSRS